MGLRASSTTGPVDVPLATTFGILAAVEQKLTTQVCNMGVAISWGSHFGVLILGIDPNTLGPHKAP